MGDLIPRMDTEGLAGGTVIEEEYLSLISDKSVQDC
jgi:hypothetical protein